MFQRIPLSAWIGIVLTSLFLFPAIFAPWIAPYSMTDSSAGVWEPFSAEHWLGTDNLGRDLLSRMIFGARTTIFIAGMATILSFTLGSILGLTAAVIGGWFDMVLSRFVDLLMSVPTLIFALVVLSVLPSNLITLIMVMGILDSTRVYRLSRAVAVDLNVMDFVEAAKLRGEGRMWIIFREILPNALSPLVAELGLRFIFQVLFLSALSFLGLGIQPPTADWGSMVRDGSRFIQFVAYDWTLALPSLLPAAAVALLTVAVLLSVPLTILPLTVVHSY